MKTLTATAANCLNKIHNTAMKAIAPLIRYVRNKSKKWSVLKKNSTNRNDQFTDYKHNNHNEMDNNIKKKDKDKR